MNEPFRITIEQYDQKTIIEKSRSDIGIEEVADMIEAALLASGWLPEQVYQIMNKEE